MGVVLVLLWAVTCLVGRELWSGEQGESEYEGCADQQLHVITAAFLLAAGGGFYMPHKLQALFRSYTFG